MTKIDLDVHHLAELARITLTDEELPRFEEQIGSILGYVAQLQDIDTDGVEEMAQVTGLINILREDRNQRTEIRGQKSEDLKKRRDELLQAAPEIEQAMVKVPAILSEG